VVGGPHESILLTTDHRRLTTFFTTEYFRIVHFGSLQGSGTPLMALARRTDAWLVSFLASACAGASVMEWHEQ
jgi:hypothetical protein